MKSKEEIEKLCRWIIGLAGADGVEVLVEITDRALTRYANNVIHQNIVQKDTSIDIRLIRDGVIGKASTNQWDEASVKAAVKKAASACKFGRPEPDLPELLGPQSYREIEAFDRETAECTPEYRAAKVKLACKAAEKKGMEAAGVFSSEQSLTAVANSAGLFAAHANTEAVFSPTVSDGRVSGWGRTQHPKVAELEFDETVDKAVSGCLAARDPLAIDPGEYTVILPPEASGDFLFFMASDVFNGLAFNEGRSPFCGKLGERLFSERLTIRDDVHHPLMLGLPFDYEGSPRQAVTLVERGVARAVVHDRATAAKANTESTGHALPQPNPWGPTPLHMVIEGGDSTVEDMIASTERGLYVTHFHYTNVIDPMRQIITGMTRDGLFLIEDGKITRPVLNLRFTESAFKAYSNIAALARRQKKVDSGFGLDIVAPGMKIDRFNFSSSTEF